MMNSPQKTRKSPARLAGQFAEVTDIYGNRIVVIFSKSNHFVFDSTNPEIPTTPLVINNAVDPVILGSFPQFVRDNELGAALGKVNEYIKEQAPNRLRDSLFVCRLLHWLKQEDLHINPSTKTIATAMEEVSKIEHSIYSMHRFIKQVESMAAQ